MARRLGSSASKVTFFMAVAVIMIDGSEKRNHKLRFQLQHSLVIERRSNVCLLNFQGLIF